VVSMMRKVVVVHGIIIVAGNWLEIVPSLQKRQN